MFKKPVLMISLAASLLLSSSVVFAYANESEKMWGEMEYAQSGDVRSRSEIIREVKDRYDAEILRIEYDDKRKVYKVRVLMPNGKVRDLTINASR